MSYRIHGKTTRGAGIIDLGEKRFAITSKDPGGELTETRYIDQTVYFGSVGGGRRWEKVDTARALRRTGIDIASFQGTPLGADPIATVEQLRAAGRVRRIDTQTIRGVATTHYQATVDLRAVAARLPASSRAAARRSIEHYIAATGYTTIPIGVWIDKQGRLRREIVGRDHSITVELYGFGPHGAIVPPPARDTVDMTRRATVLLVG